MSFSTGHHEHRSITDVGSVGTPTESIAILITDGGPWPDSTGRLSMTNVQAEVPVEEYERLRALADARGLSIQEALREAAKRWIEEAAQETLDPEDPLFSTVDAFARTRPTVTVSRRTPPPRTTSSTRGTATLNTIS